MPAAAAAKARESVLGGPFAPPLGQPDNRRDAHRFEYNDFLAMRRPIPDDIHRFLLTSVASVPFLEAMLLLHAHAGTEWSAAELAQRLYVSRKLGEELLAQLCDSGLGASGERQGTCRWNAGTAMAPIVDQLAELYAVNVVDVTELIHSRQERRAHQFADAFRLRRKEE